MLSALISRRSARNSASEAPSRRSLRTSRMSLQRSLASPRSSRRSARISLVSARSSRRSARKSRRSHRLMFSWAMVLTTFAASKAAMTNTLRTKIFIFHVLPVFGFLQLLTQRDVEFAKEIDGERALAGIGSLDQTNRRLLAVRRGVMRGGRTFIWSDVSTWALKDPHQWTRR